MTEGATLSNKTDNFYEHFHQNAMKKLKAAVMLNIHALQDGICLLTSVGAVTHSDLTSYP